MQSGSIISSASDAKEFFRRKIARTHSVIVCAFFLQSLFNKILLLSIPLSALFLSLRIFEIASVINYIIASSSALLISLLLGFHDYRKKILREPEIAAWLDYQSSGGGILMTIEEAEEILDGSWENVLKSVHLPRCELRIWKIAAPITLSSVIIMLSLLLPVSGIKKQKETPHSAMEIADYQLKIEEELNKLNEFGALNEETKEKILEELKSLEENRSASDPAKVYEQLDAIEAAIKQNAENAFAKFAKTAELSSQIESIISKLSSNPHDEKLEKELCNAAEEMKKLLSENPELEAMLVKGGLLTENAIKQFINAQFPYDKETLEKLAQTMKDAKDEALNAARELCESGLCSKNASELKEYIEKNSSEANTQGEAVVLSSEEEAALYSDPNCGGIDRGRGDAPMIFGSESPEIQPDKKYKIESGTVSPKLSESVGISFSAPEQSQTETEIFRTNTDYSAEEGSRGVSQKLSPSEKNVVKKFFQK